MSNNEKVKNSQIKEVTKARESLAKIEVELLGKISEQSLAEMKRDLVDIRALVEKLDAAVDGLLEG